MRRARVVLRGAMAAIGAAGGLCLYALGEVWRADVVPERLMVPLAVFGLSFFGAWLAMTGPLRPLRAAQGAALVAVACAVLVSLVGLRFVQMADLAREPWHVLALLLVGVLPMPFWIAASRRNWGHYPTLFLESWSIVVRVSAALVFTLLVWVVAYLSDALLGLVGVEAIGRFIEADGVPFVLSGAVLGLALAVMDELSDVVSPDLLLRLLRLLVPVLLAVIAVFLLALALRGFDRLFGAFSVAGTLIAVAATAILLVSVAVDSDDAEGVVAPPMVLATQALAALVVLPALLGAWALGLRVAEAGWTPARLAGMAAAAVAVGYGAAYLIALAAGPRWRSRVRAGNRAMALAIIVLCVIWLTPLFNAEAISARDQVARFEAGRVTAGRLDLQALQDWGKPGARAMERLGKLALDPAQTALAARMADLADGGSGRPDPAMARTELARLMPVSPADAAEVRATILAALEPWEIEDWRSACSLRLPDGRPACVLVVADFWPDVAGREAVALFLTSQGGLRHEALVPDPEGAGWQRRGTLVNVGAGPVGDDAVTALTALQDGPPTLAPVAQFQLRIGDAGLTILP